ncbi:MAG: hypothetical protein WC791_03410 [Candidatus Paceibacterota bacterium]
MNNINPHEKPQHPPLSLAPDFEVKPEIEPEDPRKPLEGKGGEWVGHDFDVKHGIKNNHFDIKSGRRVPGDQEAENAASLMKGTRAGKLELVPEDEQGKIIH